MAGKRLISINIKLENGAAKKIKDSIIKLKKDMEEKTQDAMIDLAETAIMRCYLNYKEHYPSLTGNTLHGFCAGVYNNGSLVLIRTAGQLMGRHITHKQTRPGDRGFKDYSSGEYIGSKKNSPNNPKEVREYSAGDPIIFQEVPSNGYGDSQTKEFLRGFKPNNKTGISIVVANVSPYVEFLEEERDFELLDMANSKTANDILNSFKKVVLNN